jgi:exopolyphosphatase/guanosine-5'-triphosphate,3'-diphosphate pyrophosphatase
MATPVQRKRPQKTSGLAFWMVRALDECERARADFSPDPVHDLRVALRRCRSMADSLMANDPDPAWRQMKKAGKRVFSSLGELRDAQVMEEWVHRFDSPGDPVTSTILDYLAAQETGFKQQASQALLEFDQKQWRKWSRQLPRRAGRLRPGSAIFKHLALERWTQAHELHRRALRNRSQVAFHSLRIGIKRFRYVVENFLPEQHAVWAGDLKELQDLLGDVHDLDVLWATAVRINAFPDEESKARWHQRVLDERESRIVKYKKKMVGEQSLWSVWRDALPKGEQIEALALRRLKLWGSFLDRDSTHSSHVARLALQLYDGLPTALPPLESRAQRRILRLAALLHDVGRSAGDKAHHKETYRLIHKLAAPLGWNQNELAFAAAVARYHRGALPRASQKALAAMPLPQRKETTRLAGILRLANAFDSERDGRIQQLKLSQNNGVLRIQAQGYSPRDRRAEAIAGARHLLEMVYRRPILVSRFNPRKPQKNRAV